MQARVTQEKVVTVDDVVVEGNAIWDKCKKRFPLNSKSAYSEDALSKFHREMITEHNQFAQAYPIVLRYMCELHQYNQTALRRYLEYVKYHQWKSLDNYLESQATYVVMLYKALHPRYKENETRVLYENTLRMLKQERKQFETATENAKETVEKNHERMKRRNLIETREYFAKWGADAVNVPVTVQSDDAVTHAHAADTPELIPDDDIDLGCF